MRLCVVVVAFLLSSPCMGQPLPEGSQEIPTRKPQLGRIRANNQIPKRMQHKNQGSKADGLGMCVGTSVTVAGQYQGVKGLEKGLDSKFFQYLLNRPGGSYPEKLAADVKAALPGRPFLNLVDSKPNPKLLDRLSREGHVLSMQMNTGELYNWQGIHHYVNYPHFDSKANIASVRDNNDESGIHRWMTATEALRRAKDGGVYWTFVWLKKKGKVAASSGLVALLLVAAALVVVGRRLTDPGDEAHNEGV